MRIKQLRTYLSCDKYISYPGGEESSLFRVIELGLRHPAPWVGLGISMGILIGAFI